MTTARDGTAVEEALREQNRLLAAALDNAVTRERRAEAAAERLGQQAQEAYAQATTAFHRGQEVVAAARGVQDAAHAAVLHAQEREAEARNRAAAAGADAAAARAERDLVLRSRLWRLSAPLRTVLAVLRPPPRPGRTGDAPPSAPPPASPPPASPPEPAAPESVAALPAMPELLHVGDPADNKARVLVLAAAELRVFLAGKERIVFPPAPSPAVSVVVLLWNAAPLALRCLRALRDHAGVPVEVVLWDNGSTDETGALLARVDNATVLRQEANLGFVRGCNGAVAASRAPTVLLLNSDAVLRPGALAAALRTLEGDPLAGAVGARLLLPDGTLQEAGSVVWADGVTAGTGRGEPGDGAVATWRRDVDYCSAAFLLLRRTTWDALGGFDDRFSPAYYEEVDLCLRLRARGLRVVYEPGAVVDHFEFGSGGLAAMQALSVRNRSALRRLHADALHARHLPRHQANLPYAVARLRPGQRRLLVIDDLPPQASAGAGYPRARAVLAEAVAAGWAVTLYASFRWDVEDWSVLRREVPPEVEVVTGAAAPALDEFLLARAGFWEAVWVSRPGNMASLRGVAAAHPHLLWGVRVVYDAEALFTRRDVLRAALDGAPLSPEEAEARLRDELALAAGADAVACVTTAEADAFRAATRKPVHVLAHAAVSRPAPPPFAARSGLLFVGPLATAPSPNRDGMEWFVRDVWPRVRALLPGATLSVAGTLPSGSRSALEGEGITLLGPVDDLGPGYDRARVFVAPVRYAAGLPLKVVEATLAGLPCAGTALMATLMNWTPGREMAAADDPDALAAAIVRLHEHEAEWDATRSRARTDAAARFAPDAFRRVLSALLDG